MKSNYNVGIIIAASFLSNRCLFKNRLLYKATFKWVERTELKQYCAVVSDDPEILQYARDNGFKYIVEQDTKLELHEDAFLLGVDALAHLALDGYVIAQVTSPYRESWLLEDVVNAMEANPDTMIRVSSRHFWDTGALHGLDNTLVKSIRDKECTFKDCNVVFVYQNDEAALDVTYADEVINVEEEEFLLRTIDKLKRPVNLPKQVTIVGSDRA